MPEERREAEIQRGGGWQVRRGVAASAAFSHFSMPEEKQGEERGRLPPRQKEAEEEEEEEEEEEGAPICSLVRAEGPRVHTMCVLWGTS